MEPKEKAQELVKKYIEFRIDGRPCIFGLPLSKQFALVAVQELIDQCWDYREIDLEKSCDYWKEVKQEIEKL